MDDFILRIKQNRLFILGAGFSAKAGIPMIGQLLFDCMQLFRLECPGLFERVNNYARVCFSSEKEVDYTQVNFSEFCTFLEYIELREFGGGERWSDRGSREKLAFRYYLAKAIVNSTPAPEDIPDIYIQFARQLRKYDILITFNWDPLLEVALNKVGKTFAYNNYDEADVRIYKFHGSVNWRLNSPGSARFVWKPFEFKKGMMAEELYYCDELLNKDSWRETQPLMGEVEPFLVLPGSGKAYEVRPLAPIWYKPENAFAVTHQVYIVGLSLSDDDFFIKSFFLDTLPDIDCYTGISGRKVTIINSDPSIKKNYSFIRGQENVNFVFEKFNIDHVKLMQSDNL
jgi:hypothetical protein